jgi:hypothetical protein
MSQSNRPRSIHDQLTSEAFRELAETAILELYENSETFEINDLKGWSIALRRRIAEVADHAASGEDCGPGGLSIVDNAA